MKNISHHEAQILLDICPIPMLLVNAAGAPRGYNRAFAALLGKTADTHDETLQQDELLAPLLGPGTVVNWVMPDGDERWLAVDAVNVGAESGLVARFYLDVTEKLRLRKERDELADTLRAQSLNDDLISSLLSRHGVQISLEPLVARSRRYNSPLSIISMSVSTDGDREQMLTRIAFLLKDQTRWADLVGCTADHDFILILQETTRDSALQLVEKLGAHLGRLNETADSPVLACYGVTECQKNDNAESILARAEEALNEARNNQSGTAIAI